ncbi:MAG: D-alanyl-D-alanine carboxypeptidase [Clostridia bacterium]|nr:D-alanyl-D-alanine carboxypeptidase [Clostridia bacterium]
MSGKILCRLTALIIMLAFFSISSISLADSSDNLPGIAAGSAILVESGRGQVLFRKFSSSKVHASIANKIMTAIITIEKAKLDSKVTISKESASSSGSILNLEVGEKYDVSDLLYAVVLTSANDAPVALAEFVAGDIAKFVDMMNQKARELNLANTFFKNPTGLYDESQYTTAEDLAVLIRYAISNSTFQTYFSSKGIPWYDGSSSKILVNSNPLFWSYDGVDGGKTGYNDENRQSAVTTATRNGMRIISVVIDSPAKSVLKDSELLLDYGFNNFKKSMLVNKGQSIKSIAVSDQNIDLVSNEDAYYIHPLGDSFIASLDIKTAPDIKLPVTKDKVLGVATYTLKDNTIISVNLVSDKELLPPEDNFTHLVNKLKANNDLYILVIILLIIEILLILYKISRFIKKILFARKA